MGKICGLSSFARSGARAVLANATLASVLLVGTVAPASAGALTPPSADPFYTQPESLASYAPGTILRSRQVTLQGFTTAESTTAYQLLYRTSDANEKPIAAVTTLILPSTPALGARRLLSYQTFEDSLTTNCAPSYTMRGGNNGGSTQGAEQAEMGLALLQGWDVVVPDYEGPLSEQAIGPLEGRTTLDSIRAVEHFAPAGLEGAGTPVGMMGYSGGAIPSVWANALAARYAPELNLVGVAAGGIAANVIALLPVWDGGAFSGAAIGIFVSVDRAYPELDLNTILNAKGQALAAQDATDANGCGGSIVNAPFVPASSYSNYPSMQALIAVPRVQDVFANLDLISGPAPAAPSYFYNAINDELATIGPVDQLVASDCARGAVIDYYRDPVGDHITGMAAYMPPALNYLADRFNGKSAPNTCPPV
jgi:Secretory lipase